MELTRFARTTGGLLASGIPIGEALEITASGMSLPIYKKIILDAREKILKGVSLANAFRAGEKYFPGLLVSVIKVGEKTGELAKLLESLADFYEEQADNSLKTMTSLIEPILLVIVGLLIGGMAISIVVPIYQLIGTI
jgi:type II secretory pathway component PulF